MRVRRSRSYTRGWAGSTGLEDLVVGIPATVEGSAGGSNETTLWTGEFYEPSR